MISTTTAVTTSIATALAVEAGVCLGEAVVFFQNACQSATACTAESRTQAAATKGTCGKYTQKSCLQRMKRDSYSGSDLIMQ